MGLKQKRSLVSGFGSGFLRQFAELFDGFGLRSFKAVPFLFHILRNETADRVLCPVIIIKRSDRNAC